MLAGTRLRYVEGTIVSTNGAGMDIKETATNLVEQGKAALDANGDGTVEGKEVLDALGQRAKETAEAAAVAAEEVKKGFDADGDGKVSLDEVKTVADAVADKAKGVVDGIAGKLKGE